MASYGAPFGGVGQYIKKTTRKPHTPRSDDNTTEPAFLFRKRPHPGGRGASSPSVQPSGAGAPRWAGEGLGNGPGVFFRGHRIPHSLLPALPLPSLMPPWALGLLSSQRESQGQEERAH